MRKGDVQKTQLPNRHKFSFECLPTKEFEMKEYTLVLIDENQNINIYKQDTFDETIEKVKELRDSYENFDTKEIKWILYKGNEIMASKDIE